jgi:predicted DCC family thiol-disulfide oxidoreductase YuxK
MSRPAGHAPRSRDTLAIRDAMGGSQALERLTQRLRESRLRLADLAAVLPPPLRDQVRSGTIDDQRWTLLAANAAAAAKLRNLLPLLADRLAAQGWPQRELRVKTLGAAGD